MTMTTTTMTTTTMPSTTTPRRHRAGALPAASKAAEVGVAPPCHSFVFVVCLCAHGAAARCGVLRRPRHHRQNGRRRWRRRERGGRQLHADARPQGTSRRERFVPSCACAETLAFAFANVGRAFCQARAARLTATRGRVAKDDEEDAIDEDGDEDEDDEADEADEDEYALAEELEFSSAIDAIDEYIHFADTVNGSARFPAQHIWLDRPRTGT